MTLTAQNTKWFQCLGGQIEQKKAKEVERKCFYFMGTEQQIEKLLKTEMEVRNLFYNTNYARFGIIEKLEAKRIYEQGGETKCN